MFYISTVNPEMLDFYKPIINLLRLINRDKRVRNVELSEKTFSHDERRTRQGTSPHFPFLYLPPQTLFVLLDKTCEDYIDEESFRSKNLTPLTS